MVDDDHVIRETVKLALEDEGCLVREATHGEEALALLEKEIPDVILLDMRMPVLDGWGFAREYRRRPGPHAPIIVVTATQEPRAWGRQIGADAVIAKPFELDDFLAVVSRFTPCVPDQTAPGA